MAGGMAAMFAAEEPMQRTPYGLELVLDLHDCEIGALTTERLGEYFVRLCDLIGMKRHGEPVYWTDESGVPHLHGVSGIQFIETSNVVCHALPMLRAVYLNIFSCKAFDVDAAKQFSADYWRAGSVGWSVLTRH